MPQKTIIQCPACKANVTKSVGCIGCGVCGSYFHPKFSGIPENTYAAIRKNHSTFVCKSCSNTADPQNTTGNDDLIKHIEQIQKYIEDKLEHNKSEIELQMNNGFANLEAKMDGLIENVRSEMRGELNKMKSDFNNCYSMVKEGQLNVLHFNAQSLVPRNNGSKFDEVRHLMQGCSVDAFGFKIYRNDRLYSRGGAVSLYIREDVKVKNVYIHHAGEDDHGFYDRDVEALFVEIFLNTFLESQQNCTDSKNLKSKSICGLSTYQHSSHTLEDSGGFIKRPDFATFELNQEYI
ncbi:hypothetical protein FF38_11110 [Lucilia cuprina]|uniref:Uncharacterized protein n=1 Tax=Lucilia cuprina TaxID=7375 RepID=A0A0L0CRP6_LUCCU|nr:hypothetical protein FF38_11110 [Lucilia cuprina]